MDDVKYNIAEEHFEKIFSRLERKRGPLSFENWIFFFEGENILFFQHSNYIEINQDFFSFFKETFNIKSFWEVESFFLKMTRKHVRRKIQYVVISGDRVFDGWKNKYEEHI